MRRCSTCSTTPSPSSASRHRRRRWWPGSSCICSPNSGSVSISQSCAVTGSVADLVYVSPKSGRAVSRSAGEPWRDRLLALPAFLGEAAPGEPSAAALDAGFALTGFFLARYVFEPRGEPLPEGRQYFIAAVTRAAENPAPRTFWTT